MPLNQTHINLAWWTNVNRETIKRVCGCKASPLGSTFQAIVSVMAVKIQLSSPRGVRLSLSLPGILHQTTQHNSLYVTVAPRLQAQSGNCSQVLTGCIWRKLQLESLSLLFREAAKKERKNAAFLGGIMNRRAYYIIQPWSQLSWLIIYLFPLVLEFSRCWKSSKERGLHLLWVLAKGVQLVSNQDEHSADQIGAQ